MTSLLIFPHIRFLFFFLGLFGLILRADSTDDRFSLILQMMERNILRLLHISFTDGFYQFFMLTDQKISCLLLLQIHDSDTSAHGDYSGPDSDAYYQKPDI